MTKIKGKMNHFLNSTKKYLIKSLRTNYKRNFFETVEIPTRDGRRVEQGAKSNKIES